MYKTDFVFDTDILFIVNKNTQNKNKMNCTDLLKSYGASILRDSLQALEMTIMHHLEEPVNCFAYPRLTQLG